MVLVVLFSDDFIVPKLIVTGKNYVLSESAIQKLILSTWLLKKLEEKKFKKFEMGQALPSVSIAKATEGRPFDTRAAIGIKTIKGFHSARPRDNLRFCFLSVFPLDRASNWTNRQISMAKTGDNLIRVALVDDDGKTAVHVRDLVQSEENFQSAGSFNRAATALAQMPELRPNLAVMSVRLPDLCGIECARRLMRTLPNLKVVMLGETRDSNWHERSMHAGAAAYLVKPFGRDQLLTTLRSSALGSSAAHFSWKELEASSGAPANVPSLSSQERAVLMKFQEGLLYKEIPDALGISYSALRKRQRRIFSKLKVKNRSEAVHVWLQNRGGSEQHLLCQDASAEGDILGPYSRS